MKRKIFGITGLKGSGKDTAGIAICNYLATQEADVDSIDTNVYHYNFATPLKDICNTAFGLSYECMNKPEFKEVMLPVYPFQTPRKIMQTVGSECFRAHYPDVWVECWKRFVNAYDYKNIVTTDYRFPNEAVALKEAGAVLIKVIRPGIAVENHNSENQVNSLPWDFTFINNCKSAEEFGAMVVDELKKTGHL